MSFVTLQEAKSHLRVDTDEDDALITDKIASAESHVETYLGASLSDFDPFPPIIKEAILQLIAQLYDNRDSPDLQTALALVRPFRTWTFV